MMIIHAYKSSELDIDGTVFRLVSKDEIKEISKTEFNNLEKQGVRRIDAFNRGDRYFGLSPEDAQEICSND